MLKRTQSEPKSCVNARCFQLTRRHNRRLPGRVHLVPGMANPSADPTWADPTWTDLTWTNPTWTGPTWTCTTLFMRSRPLRYCILVMFVIATPHMKLRLDGWWRKTKDSPAFLTPRTLFGPSTHIDVVLSQKDTLSYPTQIHCRFYASPRPNGRLRTDALLAYRLASGIL